METMNTGEPLASEESLPSKEQIHAVAPMSTAEGFYFDTPCLISGCASEATLKEALDICPGYEQLMSRFIEGSDVWRLNHAEGAPVEVSDDTLKVLQCADRVQRDSGGAFNIAVGAASKLWKFTGPEPRIPSEEELAAAAFTLATFSLSFEGNFVTIPAGTSIDLGGIAKGYICDRVADALRALGVESALLNFGGNIRTLGLHPKGRPWQVGLQKPSAARNEAVFAAVESSNSSVVTSGVYERSFSLNGAFYHHILDPRTCEPATSELISVSVLSDNGMLADALATAILVLGRERGFQLAQHYQVQIALLTKDEQLTFTQGMPLVVIK